MRTATTGTVLLVNHVIETYGSAKAFVRSLDPEKYDYVQIASAMSNAINGKGMGLGVENELRSALGAMMIPRVVERQVCPIHDTVHDCDCDGKQGQAVWVHPKEKLVKAPGFGRTRKERKSIEVTPEVYRLLLKFKGTGSYDWSGTLEALYYLAVIGDFVSNDEKFPEAGIQ